MKVSFTAKEYGRLLELAHLGLWVAGARPDDPGTMPARYVDVAEKVFGLAENFGCADLVETDVNGQHYPAEKLTAGSVEQALTDFTADVFWSELAVRLAERDLQAELGRPAGGEPEPFTEAQEERLQLIEETYWREFEAHGTDHVVVLRGGQG
jgi:hypothetical protein